MDSKEITLKELDKWYGQLYKDNYTPQVEKEITDIAISYLSKVCNEDDLKRISPFVITALSISSQMDHSSNYFSKNYNTLDTLVKGRSIEGRKLSDLFTKGTLEEYCNPMIDSLKPLQNFVDEVQLYVLDNKKSITPLKITEIFLNNFKDHNGFTNYCMNYLDAIPYFLDYMNARKKSSYNALIFKQLLPVLKETTPYLNEHVLGCLTEKNE
jgi:hypothetical protein